MKFFYFLLVATLFLCNQSFAQTCLPDGITFSTQQQIDDFAANYPGCTEILGDVVIEGNTDNTITSLSGLIQLTSIGSDLQLSYNSALTSLAGLNNLTSINGHFTISFNDGLTSLTDLDNLTYIRYGLSMLSNDGLINLTGLDNLTFIGTNLSIVDNDGLTSLAGLDNIPSIGEAFCNGGGLRIQANDNLTNLTGLDNVTAIYGDVRIDWNLSLTGLTGLDNVTSIGRSGYGDLEVTNNHSLTSLTGLDNVNYTAIASLEIDGNVNLTTCGISSICSFLTNGGTNTIAGNATNCSSTSEILNICMTTSVNTPDALPGISISPNPGTGLFVISGITEGDYNILNTTGQIMQSGRLNGDLSIDISAMPQGVYFISIPANNQTVMKRVVKL